MNTRIVYKEAFSVIGKMGMGPAGEPGKWILPLWDSANAGFKEIASLIRYDEKGNPAGLWGAMNDVDEQNKRWGEYGKYMAGCEAEPHAEAPEGWSKWVTPAQTYLVVDCTLTGYGEVFEKMTSNKELTIVGTVHERYPEPGNPEKIELYFPIASGTEPVTGLNIGF